MVEASGQGGLQWRPAQVLGCSVVSLAPSTLGLKLQGHKSVGTVGGHHNREAVVNIVLGLKPQPNTGGIIDRQGRLLGPQAEQAIAPLRTAPHTREVEAANSGVLDPNGYGVVLKLVDGASLH